MKITQSLRRQRCSLKIILQQIKYVDLKSKYNRDPLPGGHKTPSLRGISNSLDPCRSETPLTTTQAAAKPSTGSVLLIDMELGLQPDSGSI